MLLQYFYRARDISAGLEYLHSKNIVHRDIALSNYILHIIYSNAYLGNILARDSADGYRKLTVKISDFGKLYSHRVLPITLKD